MRIPQDHLDGAGIAQHIAARWVEPSGAVGEMGVDVSEIASQVESHRHLRWLGASTPNDPAQQRRGTGELEVSETNHAPRSAATVG